MSRDQAFSTAAKMLGYAFDGEIRIGGNYVPVARDGHVLYVAGQVPRVGDKVMVTGRAGEAVTLEQAQLAARICAMRCLALLQRTLGSLDKVRAVVRVNVYTQAAQDFTQLSEVGDAASDTIHQVLGEAGRHARTSIGVYQLPKDATVELDLIATATE